MKKRDRERAKKKADLIELPSKAIHLSELFGLMAQRYSGPEWKALRQSARDLEIAEGQGRFYTNRIEEQKKTHTKFARESMKFVLPERLTTSDSFGEEMDKNECVDLNLNPLPYDCLALEFLISDDLKSEGNVDAVVAFVSTRKAVHEPLRSAIPEGSIWVQLLCKSKGKWGVGVFHSAIIEPMACVIFDKDKDSNSVSGVQLLNDKDQVINQKEMSVTEIYNSIGDLFKVKLAIDAINCEHNTINKVSRRVMKKGSGNLPLFEYHTLTINPEKPNYTYDKDSPKGTHASPRTHLRRGHWKTSKLGKRFWVGPTIVMPDQSKPDAPKGMIHKDYKIA